VTQSTSGRQSEFLVTGSRNIEKEDWHVDNMKKIPIRKMDFNNVKAIDRAAYDFRLRIKELMHIIKLEPSLNKQLNSQSNFDIKTMIITAYPQHRK
jgi:hypothetical protein